MATLCYRNLCIEKYFVGVKVVEGQPRHTSARGLTGRRILHASCCIADVQSFSCQSRNNDRLYSIAEKVELSCASCIACMCLKFVVVTRDEREGTVR